MSSSTWWYGDLVGVTAHCFGIGFVHDNYPLALVLALVLEVITCALNFESSSVFTLIAAPLATTVAAAGCKLHVGDGNARNGGSLTEQTVFFLIQAAAYLVCRKMPASVSFRGFPTGALLALGVLVVFFLGATAVLQSNATTVAERHERLELFLGLATAVAVAHLSAVAVYLMVWSDRASPPVVLVLAAAVLLCGLLAVTAWAMRVMVFGKLSKTRK